MTGIGIILVGLVFATVSEGFPVPQGYTAMLYEWSFLAFATAGVSVLVYAGLQKSKYNIEEYNKENALERGYEDYAARKTEEILIKGLIIYMELVCQRKILMDAKKIILMKK